MRNCLVITAITLLAGCTHNDVMMKKQVELEARVEHLVQNYSGLATRLNQMDASLRDIQEKSREQATTLEEMKLAVKQPAPIQEETLAEPVAPPIAKPTKIEVIIPEAGPKEHDAAPADAYMKAFGIYGANKYPEAIEAFSTFIKNYPESDFSGNAQYWIGECYYTQSNLPQALESFKKVIEKYPKSNKVPDAMLKMAYTLYAMKEPEKAKATLESLVAKYPASHHAVIKAKERLNKR